MNRSGSRPSDPPPGAPAAPADVEFCRATLPRVSRTFALNIRLLGGTLADAVRIAYLMCRIADTIEDAWPGDRQEVERRFDQLVAAVECDASSIAALAAAAPLLEGRASAAHVELVRHAPAVLRCLAALGADDRRDVAEAVGVMARGMRRYAGRAAERGGRGARGNLEVPAYLDDDSELTDYCWIVAGCVGVMLTRLFTRRAGPSPRDAERLVLAPAVGEGLQLTNILLDWPIDVRAGRCHVPAAWLSELGIRPRDLVGHESPAVAELAARLEARALKSLARVPSYLATIPARCVRYRQFCLWPALWATASLRHARHDPSFPSGPVRPRLPRSELWRVAASSLAFGHWRGGIALLSPPRAGAKPVHATPGSA